MPQTCVPTYQPKVVSYLSVFSIATKPQKRYERSKVKICQQVSLTPRRLVWLKRLHVWFMLWSIMCILRRSVKRAGWYLRLIHSTFWRNCLLQRPSKRTHSRQMWHGNNKRNIFAQNRKVNHGKGRICGRRFKFWKYSCKQEHLCVGEKLCFWLRAKTN